MQNRAIREYAATRLALIPNTAKCVRTAPGNGGPGTPSIDGGVLLDPHATRSGGTI